MSCLRRSRVHNAPLARETGKSSTVHVERQKDPQALRRPSALPMGGVGLDGESQWGRTGVGPSEPAPQLELKIEGGDWVVENVLALPP